MMIDSDRGSKKDQQRSYTAWVEGTRPKLLSLPRGGGGGAGGGLVRQGAYSWGLGNERA